MREFILQYQQSTGMWVDCVDRDKTEQYLTLCERATGKSRQEVLSALEAGQRVRYDPEDWYCYCRYKPAPKTVEVEEELTIDCPTCHGKKEWVDIESRTITLCPDCNDLEPEQAMIKCDYCGRSVPISSIISASLGNSCPDCYVD